MRRVPTEYTVKGPARDKPVSPSTITPQSTHSQRHGDRDAGEDGDGDEPPPVLGLYVRFADLVAANIVTNWPTLLRWQDKHGFPLGVLIGNTRCWLKDEVDAWIASQPTARKIPPLATKPRGRKSKKSNQVEATA